MDIESYLQRWKQRVGLVSRSYSFYPSFHFGGTVYGEKLKGKGREGKGEERKINFSNI